MIADPIRAGNFVAFFEGLILTAKYDVNSWRVGYGSDTEGPQGVPVVEGSTTTPERAKANLRLRLIDFEAGIVKAIGAPAWAALGTGAQAAGLSFMYNYGRLNVGGVEAAVKTGKGIRAAIRQRPAGDRGGNG